MWPTLAIVERTFNTVWCAFNSFERRCRSPPHNFFLQGKEIPFPIYTNVRAYIILYMACKIIYSIQKWVGKVTREKRHFRRFSAGFRPFSPFEGVRVDCSGFVNDWFIGTFWNPGKQKWRKKTYLFFRHFHDTKVPLFLIPARARCPKFSIYICFLINYIGFLYETAPLIDQNRPSGRKKWRRKTYVYFRHLSRRQTGSPGLDDIRLLVNLSINIFN